MPGLPSRVREALRLHRSALGLLLLAFSCAACAVEPIILTSRSKQFMVRGRPQTSSSASAQPEIVQVDPALLSLVCERVREALQRELGWGEQWRDPVFVNVHPTLGTREERTPIIQPIESGAKGWRYRIEMPEHTTRRDFLQCLIEVLLLEYANRGARAGESVELPRWIVDGVTEVLVHGPLAGLTLHVNTISSGQANTIVPLKPYSYTVRERYSEDPRPALLAEVQAQGALSVDQITWPDHDERDVAAVEKYRRSVQLFVTELLRMKGGREAFCATLALLPENLNWQTAFLRGFEGHFSRMLDVEKWWSLVLVQARARENMVQWSPLESQSRIEDVLYTPMQVRISRDEVPHVTPVALQTIVREWSFREQEPILRNKVKQLFVLRARVPQEFGVLIDEYRLAIEGYLTARASKRLAEKDESARAIRALKDSIVTALDDLDRRRAQIVVTAAKTASAAGVVPLTPP